MLHVPRALISACSCAHLVLALPSHVYGLQHRARDVLRVITATHGLDVAQELDDLFRVCREVQALELLRIPRSAHDVAVDQDTVPHIPSRLGVPPLDLLDELGTDSVLDAAGIHATRCSATPNAHQCGSEASFKAIDVKEASEARLQYVHRTQTGCRAPHLSM